MLISIEKTFINADFVRRKEKSWPISFFTSDTRNTKHNNGKEWHQTKPTADFSHPIFQIISCLLPHHPSPSHGSLQITRESFSFLQQLVFIFIAFCLFALFDYFYRFFFFFFHFNFSLPRLFHSSLPYSFFYLSF